MKNITRHYGMLNILGRLPSSTNGNPRFKAEVMDVNGGYITFITAVDSSYGYSIENYQNKEVVVTVGSHYGQPTLNSIEKVQK